VSNYFTQNFDGVTPPALPAGWSTTGPSGYSIATTSAVSRSGANSLQVGRGSGGGGYMYAYVPGTLDTTGRGSVRLSTYARIDGTSTYSVPALYLFCTGAPSGTTRPTNSVSFLVGLDNSVMRFEGADGFPIYPEIFPAGGTFSANAWYYLEFVATPDLTSQRLLLAGYVRRDSDGAWLSSNITWGPAGGNKVPCMVQRYVPTFIAAWRSGTFASLGGYFDNPTTAYFDDVSFDSGDLPTVSPDTPASAPSDEVEVIASTTVSSDGGTSGNGPSNILDGNPTTYYESSGANAYIGVDLGSGNTVKASRIRLMPADGLYTGGGNFPLASIALGLNLEASNNGSTWEAFGCTSLATFPERYVYLDIPLNTQATAYRYFRLRGCINLSVAIGEMTVCGSLADFGGSPSWRPCPPAMTPASGKFANGQTVAMTCPTAGASIYYTTDGSTPTTGSTLYAGPITLPSNATTTVKAISYHASGTTTTSGVTSGHFMCPPAFVPDTQLVQPNTGTPGNYWPETIYDTRGVPLDVAYTSVYVDSATNTYYRYSQTYNRPTYTLDIAPQGYRCYTSTDLMNWTPLANPLVPNVPGDWPINYTVRLIFLKNTSPIDPNRTYVGWARVYGPFGTFSASCSAPAITGPWKWEQYISTQNNGDCSLFIDDDGAWYLLFSDASVPGVSIWKLDASTDHTTPETKVTSGPGQNYWSISPGSNREGVGLFYHYHLATKYYYLVYSQLQDYGQQPAHIWYRSATTIGGLVGASENDLWSGGQPAAGTGPGGTTIVATNAQFSNIFSVIDNPNQIILGTAIGAFGVSPLDLSTCRDAWWPLIRTDFTAPGVMEPQYQGNDTWDLSVFPENPTGTANGDSTALGQAGSRGAMAGDSTALGLAASVGVALGDSTAVGIGAGAGGIRDVAFWG
jgi:hypothetical protein